MMLPDYHFKSVKQLYANPTSLIMQNCSQGSMGGREEIDMINRLLHTPEGVRDIYNSECERKLLLQDRIKHLFYKYGFASVETPTFEFFDIFNKERGTIPANEMYKFFDRDGNTLVLRPDFTPSIARCTAQYYKEEEYPIRLCYTGNTFINNSNYQGKLKESTQIGAELINDESIDADAEMIALTIESLLKAGLTEFQVEIGHADFFRGLVEEAGFDELKAEQLRELIENKNIFGVEELVSEKSIEKGFMEVFLKLPELFGALNILETAKTMTRNHRAVKAVERLQKLYDILDNYGLKDYITFDLGMLSKYNYYSGIIYRAYTYGTGDAVATGGRYDNLLGQFGKDAPAIGLAIVIDQLMLALSRQKIEIPIRKDGTLILFEEAQRSTAIRLTIQFRKDNMSIELLCKSPSKDLSEYREFALRKGIGGILYLENEDTVLVMDSKTGSRRTAKLSDLAGE